VAVVVVLAHTAFGCALSTNRMSVRSPFAPERRLKQDLDRSLALQAVSCTEASARRSNHMME